MLLGFTLLGAKASAAAGNGWLAYGDLRGHFEPCGCDPTTDLGGVKRLAVVLDRERSVHPEAWLFGLGNDVPTASEGPLKTPFLVETDVRLKPTAVLLNTLEIARAGELKKLSKRPPYVLSNAKGASPDKLAAASIVTKNAVVLGFVEAAGQGSGLEPYGAALAKKWAAALKAHPAAFKVLLYSGSDATLVKINASQQFDAIISSNSAPLETMPGTAEKDDEKKLLRAGGIAMVPLAGQGILRGGSLEFDEAKPLSELLKDQGNCSAGAGLFGKSNCAPTPTTAAIPQAKLVTWLTVDSAVGDGPLKDVYDRYQAAARDAFLNAGAERVKDLKDSPYAGAEACASCHPEQSKVYAKSAHAHAMADLQAKGKHEDPECVACHAVGATAKGGFVSLAASPQLANVQCENCHGPRLAHSRDPTHKPAEPPPPASTMCVTCHVGQHSPQFNFATYWPRIQH